jgi:hypothetical protein
MAYDETTPNRVWRRHYIIRHPKEMEGLPSLLMILTGVNFLAVQQERKKARSKTCPLSRKIYTIVIP